MFDPYGSGEVRIDERGMPMIRLVGFDEFNTEPDVYPSDLKDGEFVDCLWYGPNEDQLEIAR